MPSVSGRLVRAAVRYALDDAYNRLVRNEHVSAYRLDRLLDDDYANGCLWSELLRTLHASPARLGLA